MTISKITNNYRTHIMILDKYFIYQDKILDIFMEAIQKLTERRWTGR